MFPDFGDLVFGSPLYWGFSFPSFKMYYRLLNCCELTRTHDVILFNLFFMLGFSFIVKILNISLLSGIYPLPTIHSLLVTLYETEYLIGICLVLTRYGQTLIQTGRLMNTQTPGIGSKPCHIQKQLKAAPGKAD